MITIDSEFRSLIPPLTPEELAGLEASVLAEGCRDALIVWGDILIDGHNRYEICQLHNIPFATKNKGFSSRDEAIDWIYSNQLGRRNLTDEERTYLIGKQYEARKKRDWSRHPVEGQNVPLPTTAKKIGDEQGINEKTVMRAAEYAKAIDKLKKTVGKKTTDKILSGELKTTKQKVIALANESAEQQQKEVNYLTKFKNTEGLFTSDSEDWLTPVDILDSVYSLFNDNLTLDPCASLSDIEHVKAKTRYTQKDDGVDQEWEGTVFMNPPYGAVIGVWTEKAIDEYRNGKATEIVILVPARTDTTWFQALVDYPWCAVKGRLRFGGSSKNSAPFPSAIFYLGENVKGFFECFENYGTIFRKMVYEEADQEVQP